MGVVKLNNRQVRKFLEEIVGKSSVDILKACEQGCTDEEIVNETQLKLNTVRSQLNTLHHDGLIRYDREKNPDTNWYTYTWFAQTDKITEIIRANWQTHLDKMEQKLDYESNYVFFVCDKNCGKLPFELAAEYDFICPDCGTELRNIDNKDTIKGIIDEMEELKKLIGQVVEKETKYKEKEIRKRKKESKQKEKESKTTATKKKTTAKKKA